MAIRKHLSSQKGFTLVELLVVVAILGILATVAIPRVMGAIDSARERKALADMTVIRDTLERFYLDWGIFPPSLDYLKSEGYIGPDFTFKNSYGNYYTYVVKYVAASDPQNFKDYALGDPGQTPLALDNYTNTSTTLPQGLYDPTNHDVYMWGYDDGASMVLTGSVTATNLNNVSKPFAYRLNDFWSPETKDNTVEPTNPLFKFTGQ